MQEFGVCILLKLTRMVYQKAIVTLKKKKKKESCK